MRLTARTEACELVLADSGAVAGHCLVAFRGFVPRSD
jgi:hypothetical protein